MQPMSTKPQPIKFKDVTNQENPEAYIAYAGNGGLLKYNEASKSAISVANGISRASIQTNFQNIRPGISGRPSFGRDDYEYFRPGEALPRRYKDIIKACDNLYYHFPLVRNVIDLMSDFACQGIKFVHPVKSHERFYNAWFKKINGFDRSERFLSYFYRHAMVVVETRVGDLPIKIEREFMSQAGNIQIETRQVKSGELPLQYVFHYPGIVTVKENSNINSDKVLYEIQEVDNKNTSTFRGTDLVGLSGKKRPLPPDKTFVYYYKRDDWRLDAIPFLYTLILPALMIEKLKLADSAALDGAISAVRIFQLGDVEHKITPTAAAVSKLDEILQSHVGGGTLDIIWPGPINLIESKTDVHNFLGEKKYAPHLEDIYNGLGIPPTLAGKGGTGTTNNYISLKQLTKRLQYGRKVLIDFWDEQIKWVQKAMKFPRPAKIEFDFLDLGDEQAEKALLIQLADRNLISDEKLQTIFGYETDMEKARLNRESRERKSGRRVEKPTALNDPSTLAMKKIALQKGYVSHEQLGIKVEPGTEKQKPPFKEQMDAVKQRSSQVSAPQKGKTTRGRPNGAKDSTKRKTKVFRPKIKAALDLWVQDGQNKVNDIVKSEFLKLVNKSNFRQLTQKEAQQYEKLTFGVITSIEPFTEITKDIVVASLEKPVDNNLFDDYLEYSQEVAQELNRELTLDEMRKIKSIIYSSLYKDKLKDVTNSN